MLGELHDFPEGTMAIGRLDYDSEGLLMLTTDGKVSYEVLSNKVEKEYYVQVDGIISQDDADKLGPGVEISINGKKYKTKKCKAKLIPIPSHLPTRNKKIRDERHGPTSWLSITLREGKYRQVRKMTAVIGFPTLRLVRVRIGEVNIESMKSGEVRQMKTLL